jgi:hypothetical protein
METVIKGLIMGNDIGLRQHFFEIMRDLNDSSDRGDIAWSQISERITQELILNNQMVEKYWPKQ